MCPVDFHVSANHNISIQIEFLSNIARLYRGEEPEMRYRETSKTETSRWATMAEMEAKGWSLNPGRYVGVAEREVDDFVFAERLEELNDEPDENRALTEKRHPQQELAGIERFIKGGGSGI